MGQQNRIAVVVLVIAFVLVQGAMIGADQAQTPVRVAKQFTQDYFALKPQMGRLLCSDLNQEGETVTDYIYSKAQEAKQRGLPLDYLRQRFAHMMIDIVEQDQTSAKIHVSGTTRRAINPVFMVVGQFFFIGENYKVDTVLDLVHEEDGWRVCGAPFDLAPDA